MGDITCFGRMDRMAEGLQPLLRLDPPGRPVERTTGVRLTEAGARMLAGEADQILNGIDRWIGGVHLQGHYVRLATDVHRVTRRSLSAESRRTPSRRPAAIGPLAGEGWWSPH